MRPHFFHAYLKIQVVSDVNSHSFARYSWMSRSFLINNACSNTRLRCRSTSLVPMVCVASCCKRSNCASEGNVFNRTSFRADTLAVAMAWGVGNFSRNARAERRLGSRKMVVNSGNNSSQMDVSLFLRCVHSWLSS